MMKEKKKGLLQRGIMVAVSALTIVTGAGTVLAYETFQSSDESFNESIFDNSLNTLFNCIGDMMLIDDFSESDKLYF